MFQTIQGHRIEYEFIRGQQPAPVMVFLHEGLGSVAMWKDFPARCAHATGYDALVYSRYGYGQSDPITEPRRVEYMHDEALKTLPELLAKLDIQRPILFGHSDGASIALIHAGRHPVAGVVVLAPHLFVEDIALDGIRSIRSAYEAGDLKSRLARYHADPDSAFWGWHDIWLHPDLRAWNIQDCVDRIQSPVLAIQGIDDEYGSMEHLDRIPRAELLKLENCRHSPHRDQPEAVIAATSRFVRELNKPNGKETRPTPGT